MNVFYCIYDIVIYIMTPMAASHGAQGKCPLVSQCTFIYSYNLTAFVSADHCSPLQKVQ